LRELLTFHPNGNLGERSDCPPAWRALIRDARNADPADRPSLIEFRDRLLDRLSTPPAAIPVAQTVPARPATPPPAPAPRKVELPREIVNSIGMRFVLIPAGKFLMGSPEDLEARDDYECPQHEVEISKPFYLGVFQVTQAQWQSVMGSNPSCFCATG